MPRRWMLTPLVVTTDGAGDAAKAQEEIALSAYDRTRSSWR